MIQMNSKHWEFKSICPKCDHVSTHSSPIGEVVVRIHCEHCSHGYEYTHVIIEHKEVEDIGEEAIDE